MTKTEMMIESWADARIKILFLARQATEEKKTDLARQLTAQAQTLRAQMAALRNSGHSQRQTDSRDLLKKIKPINKKLEDLIAIQAKTVKHWAAATKVLKGLATLSKQVVKII